VRSRDRRHLGVVSRSVVTRCAETTSPLTCADDEVIDGRLGSLESRG
jgi:hypothetical protein